MLPTGEVWRIPWRQISLDTQCGKLIDYSTFGKKRKRNTFSNFVKMSILLVVTIVMIGTFSMEIKSNGKGIKRLNVDVMNGLYVNKVIRNVVYAGSNERSKKLRASLVTEFPFNMEHQSHIISWKQGDIIQIQVLKSTLPDDTDIERSINMIWRMNQKGEIEQLSHRSLNLMVAKLFSTRKLEMLVKAEHRDSGIEKNAVFRREMYEIEDSNHGSFAQIMEFSKVGRQVWLNFNGKWLKHKDVLGEGNIRLKLEEKWRQPMSVGDVHGSFLSFLSFLGVVFISLVKEDFENADYNNAEVTFNILIQLVKKAQVSKLKPSQVSIKVSDILRLDR